MQRRSFTKADGGGERRDTGWAMSRQNMELDRQNREIEVIREVYAHWERGDFTSWEAFADDYVWKPVDAIEAGEYTADWRARSAARRW